MAKEPLEPKWLFYLLSFFVPVLGVVLGAVFYSGTEGPAKEFGKMCLIFGVVGFVLLGFSFGCGHCGFCYPYRFGGCYRF